MVGEGVKYYYTSIDEINGFVELKININRIYIYTSFAHHVLVS